MFKKIVYLPLFLISLPAIALAFLIHYLHPTTGSSFIVVLGVLSLLLLMIFGVINGIKFKLFLYEKNYLTTKIAIIIGLLFLVASLSVSPLFIDNSTVYSNSLMCLFIILVIFFTPIIILFNYLLLSIGYLYVSQDSNTFLQLIFVAIFIWFLWLTLTSISALLSEKNNN